ncbi:cyclin-dependent kinase-like 3 isoform X1 [Micropterus salmoides]|uniref:cyclin-dependent kinase-like 3 isoform X1 n=1 Tax=Micropterus salmoides TaxID=27706 RepID=UPI0018EC07F0|nr:cyclin-dependent kinase-like 3 isoform X1 [Micropterus salmoides]
MERYESLGLVGEGSYGTVLKCRHRDSGRLVAIKKFMDSDNDKTVKKIALREIKLLRQLRHDNLVNLLEVWKRRRRWHLVFEFVERTLLDDLEQNPNGLDLNTSRQYLYQILRAAAFCHQQNIIHRDIKPENILISQGGVVKLCDFGFARTMTSPAEGGVYTDYVATRWYRAPELLVGDTKYSKPVDVWAVGCLLIEMLTGQPLFPGDSDLDQIYHIVRCFGNLTAHHQELFYRNPVFSGVRLPEYFGRVRLEQRFPTITPTALDLAQSCLQMDPERRAQCSELLEHPLFTQDSFHIRVLDELNAKIQKDHRENSTLPKIAKNPRREKDEGDEKNWRGKYKKQSEDIDVKVSKEKVRKGEEKVEKTKGKQSSKPSKTIRNTSEPFMSTKQSKTLGVKIIENAAKTTVAMKSKLGKPTGAELRKEADISRPTKIVASDSSEGADQKENYTVVAKPKHEKAASPEPRQDNLKATKNTTTDTVQRGTSESSKVLPSDPSPSKTTSNCGSKMTTSNTSLSTSPSKTLISEFLTRSSTVFIEASPDHSPTTLPKGTLNSKLSKTDSSSDTTTTTNHPTFVPNKALKVLSTDRELKELLIATKNQQDSCSNTSNKDISDDYESMKMSQATKTAENHIEISNGSSRYYKGDPDSSEPSRVHQQSTSKSKITTESRTSLTSIPNEIPITNTSLWTTIPKTLNVSDKENREDLAFSVSISATTKSFVNQISKVSRNSTTEQKNDSSEGEPNTTSLKLLRSKSFIGEPNTKLGSLNNHTKSTATMALKSTEAGKKRDDSVRNDTTNINTISDSTSFTSTVTTDQRALTRSSVFHNVDSADVDTFDFSVSHSSPVPPAPLPPSSTPLIPSFSFISTNSPVSSDRLTLGAGFHPGTNSFRCVEKPRHHGGIYSRMTQKSLSSHITGSLTAQVPEKSLICERSFLSDRFGNNITATRKKSDIHFPDLRSSTLPELRGRESKHNKGASKDQRKDKHPDFSNPTSESAE